jgi:4-hydroxy-tetrahydrodipicolinate reductase
VTRAAVFGSGGRMGKLVTELSSGRIDIVQAFEVGDNLNLDPGIEVVIDFSLFSAWSNLNTLISGTGAALVSGTTGLSQDQYAMLNSWAEERPVFYSSNMSVGIHVLGKLMKAATCMLGDSFDRELIEIHHRGKKDSPSGTALSLLNQWSGNRIYGRLGSTEARQPGTVGVHSVRGGDVVGEHHLHFLGDGERITISHLATDRRVFALGAIRAAQFITGKPKGLYGMEDMLG